MPSVRKTDINTGICLKGPVCSSFCQMSSDQLVDIFLGAPRRSIFRAQKRCQDELSGTNRFRCKTLADCGRRLNHPDTFSRSCYLSTRGRSLPPVAFNRLFEVIALATSQAASITLAIRPAHSLHRPLTDIWLTGLWTKRAAGGKHLAQADPTCHASPAPDHAGCGCGVAGVTIAGSRQGRLSRSIAQRITSSFLARATMAIFFRPFTPRLSRVTNSFAQALWR